LLDDILQYIYPQHYIRLALTNYFPHNLYSICITHTSLLFALQHSQGLPTLHLPSEFTPFCTVRLLSVLHTQPTNLCVKSLNHYTRHAFHIISILHAQPIFHHCSLHYNLTEWTAYIKFTNALTPICTVSLLSVLHARPTNLFVKLVNHHTQPASHIMPILLTQPLLHHCSLHYKLTE